MLPKEFIVRLHYVVSYVNNSMFHFKVFDSERTFDQGPLFIFLLPLSLIEWLNSQQVCFAGCRLKFNYNWKTAGT